MRRGVRLGIDPGGARIGVAVCDPDGLLAVPLVTVPSGRDQWDRLVALVAEHRPIEVVVGLPLRLSGGEGPAAANARVFAGSLAERIEVPVRLVDERLSSVEAGRSLREAGRSSRTSRSVIDQAAAVVVLQAALDAERASGRPPGAAVAAPETSPLTEDGR
jgi:putative Holliday junction resolvase